MIKELVVASLFIQDSRVTSLEGSNEKNIHIVAEAGYLASRLTLKLILASRLPDHDYKVE
jgi:hypothetical protein